MISDLDMPEMSGFELLQKLLAYDPSACVIIVSGNPDKTIPQKALSQGAKEFISKSDDLLQLVESVKKLWKEYIGKKQEGENKYPKGHKPLE